MCYINKTISVKVLVIFVINSSRHRKCFVQGRSYDIDDDDDSKNKIQLKQKSKLR